MSARASRLRGIDTQVRAPTGCSLNLQDRLRIGRGRWLTDADTHPSGQIEIAPGHRDVTGLTDAGRRVEQQIRRRAGRRADVPSGAGRTIGLSLDAETGTGRGAEVITGKTTDALTPIRVIAVADEPGPKGRIVGNSQASIRCAGAIGVRRIAAGVRRAIGVVLRLVLFAIARPSAGVARPIDVSRTIQDVMADVVAVNLGWPVDDARVVDAGQIRLAQQLAAVALDARTGHRTGAAALC